MNFILEGKICFTETEWKCKTSLPSKMKFIVVDIVSVKHNLPSKMIFITVGWNSTVAAMYN